VGRKASQKKNRGKSVKSKQSNETLKAVPDDDQSHQQEIEARYRRAQQFERGGFNKAVAFNTTLYPHWVGDSDCFWYRQETRDGHHFRIVDAPSTVSKEFNRLAFDHSSLADALSAASGEFVDEQSLPLTDLDLTQAPRQISFSAFGQSWCFDATEENCVALESLPVGWRLSPDENRAIFVRDNNLWLHDRQTREERPLTTDGERFYRYASTPTVYGRQEMITLEAIWSPDSKRVFTQVLDTRAVGIGPPIVEHVPADGSLRPRLKNPDRRVALFEDKEVETYRFLVIDVVSDETQFADYPVCPVFRPPYVGYFTSRRGWWHSDSRYAFFIDQQRGGKVANLVRLDSHTGHTEIVIEETSDYSVMLTPITHMHMLHLYVPETNELIWFSERSGSAHLYLYDLNTNKLKHAITGGQAICGSQWVVRQLLHFDNERRELLIQTAARVGGRNPYYCDICSVNIDTGSLEELVASDHEYVVCDQRSRLSMRAPLAHGVSPSGNYIVVTRSRVDQVPVSLLLDRDGRELQILETADTSGLPQDCTWPEPVMLKAADGETDIYAVIFRPSDFDSEKNYPVLDCSYNYATPVGSFTNNTTGSWQYLSAWAYAELGFICVIIFNRGNDGLRDCTFNSYQDPIMPLDPLHFRFNKEDCVAGIQQLASQQSSIDLSRVGVVEFGSIPAAISGLLLYPEFYKVGVSVSGLADFRLFGSIATRDEGYPEFEHFAHQLQGKLLLINGMLEDVIPVSMTFRLVEALQKANKPVDMLLLPNLVHGSTDYTVQRSWDYVVEHLLGLEPPRDFQLISAFHVEGD
jgi:dipeptidyl aminopeptidase/acylaminoacyl peptidase